MIQKGSNREGGNTPPTIDVPTPEQEAKLAKMNADLNAAQQRVVDAVKAMPKLMAGWEAKALSQAPEEKNAWDVIAPESVNSQGGATMVRQSDGSYLATGNNPAKDVYIITAKMPDAPVSAFLLECLPDASLPNQSLGRAPNGNFVLQEIEVDVVTAENAGNPVQAKIVKAQADYSQKGYEITNLQIESAAKGRKKPAKRGPGWAVDGSTKREPRKALFVLDKPAPAGSKVTITLKHGSQFDQHNIGRFRLSTTGLPANAVKLDGKSDFAAVRAIFNTPAAKRTAKQKGELEKYYRTAVASPVRDADKALAAAQKAAESLEKDMPTVMVMKELDKPRDAFILKRGEYDKPADKVSMATPAVLQPMPQGAPQNRLGLAQWLVDPKNPLTARVWVNRIWEKFFGYGICKTTENFGSQADWPTHPELLDWLATEFIRQKWDMKALQKMLVMSATYRQSSKLTKELIERDPENRLLARGPRFRLSGEVVRDQALAVSGLLVPKVGGPSVRPYMPEGVWDETSKYGDLRGYKADGGENLYRRSIYTIWKRTAAPPSMLLFDAPTREICTVKRSRTNTPLQALSLLNEVTFVEASRGLAEQMMKHATTPEERIAYGFRRASAKMIDDAVLKGLAKGFNERLAFFKSHADDAKKLIAQGASKPDTTLDPAELAAYTTTAEVLLNLDRVVTRD